MNALTKLNVSGAYGRDYDDEASALADWVDGKDFKIVGGPYMSIRDKDKLYADGYYAVVIHSFDGLPLTMIPLK